MADKNLKAHLFVCTNEKKGECCGEKGGAKLRARIKELSKEHPEWKGQVRINAAGCLGRCEEGIVAVLYPEGKWFTGLDVKDEDLLINAVKNSLDGK
jgi:(2Fe-2S) ferredoxin